MMLNSLLLKSFRNYSELALEFSSGFNFFCGPNGAGKTNILEAVYILSTLRSFRGASDSDIYMKGSDNYYCRCGVKDSVFNSFEVGCSGITGTGKRRMKIDGVEISTIFNYYGKLLSVAFTPDDINLINGPAEIRRRYFDSVISKFNSDYMNALREYRKIVALRNTLLKSYNGLIVTDTRQLDVWDFMLAEKAIYIIKEREKFSYEYNKYFKNNYEKIITPESYPGLTYKNSSDCADSDTYITKLKSRLKRDVILGYTGMGPHRDDYPVLDASGSDFTSSASQGQRRAASLAVKLAEMEILESITGSSSVLLVDDVFPEFDIERRHNLISLFRHNRQAFFTMADISIIDSFSGAENRIFQVSDKGKVNEI